VERAEKEDSTTEDTTEAKEEREVTDKFAKLSVTVILFLLVTTEAPTVAREEKVVRAEKEDTLEESSPDTTEDPTEDTTEDTMVAREEKEEKVERVDTTSHPHPHATLVQAAV